MISPEDLCSLLFPGAEYLLKHEGGRFDASTQTFFPEFEELQFCQVTFRKTKLRIEVTTKVGFQDVSDPPVRLTQEQEQRIQHEHDRMYSILKEHFILEPHPSANVKYKVQGTDKSGEVFIFNIETRMSPHDRIYAVNAEAESTVEFYLAYLC